MDEGETSVVWVIVLVMMLIAALGWAFMAAGYAHSEEGWRSGGVGATSGPVGSRRAGRAALAEFCWNALVQIPNAVAVISYTFTNRIWLPIVILVLEGLAVIGGFLMKRVEVSLNAPSRRRRSR